MLQNASFLLEELYQEVLHKSFFSSQNPTFIESLTIWTSLIATDLKGSVPLNILSLPIPDYDEVM